MNKKISFSDLKRMLQESLNEDAGTPLPAGGNTVSVFGDVQGIEKKGLLGPDNYMLPRGGKKKLRRRIPKPECIDEKSC